MFKTLRSKLLIKPWYIAIYLMIMTIVILSGFIEYESRYQDILELIQDQSAVTASVIAQSASSQAYLTEEIRYAYIDRALDVLNIMNSLETQQALDKRQLKDLLGDHDVLEFVFVDAQGRIEDLPAIQTSRQKDQKQPDNAWVLRYLRPLLNHTEELVITVQDQEPGGESRFLVAIPREKGGAIACYLTPLAEAEFNDRTSIDLALEDLLYVRGLRYLQVTIDGGETFYAAREGMRIDNTWSRESLEDILYKLSKGNETLLEIVRPVFFNSSMGEVRIGFVADELLSLRSQIIMQVALRSGLITILAFVILVWLLTRQNAALLASEKARIEAEVYRLEKLNRVNEKQIAMGELAAGVAHEIRNPLNAIGIVAQRLKLEFKPEKDSAEYESLTGTMVAEITRINNSLQDFLEYTRPTPLNCTKANLKDIFRKLLDLYRSQAAENKLDLRLETPDLELEVDEAYFQQALSNLIKNALEACSAGARITIEAKKLRNRVMIVVTDTGMGIEQENLNRIFDLYYTNKNMGTGVGLAITHKIIADHQGTIEVTSEVGAGTKFEINLPVKQ